MRDTRPLLHEIGFPSIARRKLETLQVNLGYRCNQQCVHCHVNASPKRREVMARATIDQVLAFLEASGIASLDLTGGAPELNPDFRYLVHQAASLGVSVIDRCNLTILEEPGQEDLAGFLAAHRVRVVASLPCYLEDNVDGQRGKGVFQGSLTGLRRLNALGYGDGQSGLVLDLVYNPLGATLPPPQCTLEADYKRELGERYGVRFDHLLTLVNMPIQRFGSTLLSKGLFQDYMRVLRDAHDDANLEQVMCRSLLSVDWKGFLFDCDFNQMLDLPLRAGGESRMHISEVDPERLAGNGIVVADHCFGCTAGQGSSCGGALS